MAENSNIDELMASLDGFLDSFNFQRKGIDQSLGRDVALCVVRGPDAGQLGGIAGRIAKGVQPDGTPMKENSPEYAAMKERRYQWSETNHRTGQMESMESMTADIRIEPDKIELHYGTGQAPDKSVSPNGFISKSDRRIDDRTKAMYAHAQGRAFFGTGEGDLANCVKVGQANLDDHIRDWNQGNG